MKSDFWFLTEIKFEIKLLYFEILNNFCKTFFFLTQAWYTWYFFYLLYSLLNIENHDTNQFLQKILSMNCYSFQNNARTKKPYWAFSGRKEIHNQEKSLIASKATEQPIKSWQLIIILFWDFYFMINFYYLKFSSN